MNCSGVLSRLSKCKSRDAIGEGMGRCLIWQQSFCGFNGRERFCACMAGSMMAKEGLESGTFSDTS